MRLEIVLLPGQQLFGQGHVFQCGILGEQVEGLKHQPEMKSFFPHFALPLSGGGVEDDRAINRDSPLIRCLQKIQAPQQSCFTATR